VRAVFTRAGRIALAVLRQVGSVRLRRLGQQLQLTGRLSDAHRGAARGRSGLDDVVRRRQRALAPGIRRAQAEHGEDHDEAVGDAHAYAARDGIKLAAARANPHRLLSSFARALIATHSLVRTCVPASQAMPGRR
jgi:hypothetical protein